VAPERLCTRDGLLLLSLDLNSQSTLARVLSPSRPPWSARERRVWRRTADRELVRAPWHHPSTPIVQTHQLTSVASRRSFSQREFIGGIGRRRRSSFWWGAAVPCIVQSAPCGQRHLRLVGQWSVSAIPAAMTVSTTWGTKICRPRGRQPGRWRQPSPGLYCSVPWLPEAKSLLVPLGRHARPNPAA